MSKENCIWVDKPFTGLHVCIQTVQLYIGVLNNPKQTKLMDAGIRVY